MPETGTIERRLNVGDPQVTGSSRRPPPTRRRPRPDPTRRPRRSETHSPNAHGVRYFLDSRQRRHIADLFIHLVIHVPNQSLICEDDAGHAHPAGGLDPPFILGVSASPWNAQRSGDGRRRAASLARSPPFPRLRPRSFSFPRQALQSRSGGACADFPESAWRLPARHYRTGRAPCRH